MRASPASPAMPVASAWSFDALPFLGALATAVKSADDRETAVVALGFTPSAGYVRCTRADGTVSHVAFPLLPATDDAPRASGAWVLSAATARDLARSTHGSPTKTPVTVHGIAGHPVLTREVLSVGGETLLRHRIP